MLNCGTFEVPYFTSFKIEVISSVTDTIIWNLFLVNRCRKLHSNCPDDFCGVSGTYLQRFLASPVAVCRDTIT